MTARLARNLCVDARLNWGLSDNLVSPYGTYEDSFNAERWLATAGLFGTFEHKVLMIRPELKFSWFSEQSKAYTDSLSNVIPAVKTELGTLEFGPSFSTRLDVFDGFTLAPRGTVKGIWTFADANRVNVPGAGATQVSQIGVRASLEAGLDLAHEGGFALSATGSYDGIGDSRYDAMGLQLGIRKAW